MLARKIVLSKIKKLTLKKHDVVRVGKYKYVVYKFGRSSVDLIPIDVMLDGDEPVPVVPKMTVDKNLLVKHEKLDSIELLFLLNQTNPLIREVLEDYLEKTRG
jgi:hypothetical protein